MDFVSKKMPCLFCWSGLLISEFFVKWVTGYRDDDESLHYISNICSPSRSFCLTMTMARYITPPPCRYGRAEAVRPGRQPVPHLHGCHHRLRAAGVWSHGHVHQVRQEDERVSHLQAVCGEGRARLQVLSFQLTQPRATYFTSLRSMDQLMDTPSSEGLDFSFDVICVRVFNECLLSL